MERNSKGQFKKGTRIIDMTGKVFGRIKVTGKSERRSGRKTYWVCICECGNKKEIRSDCLGIVNSCGCLKKEQDIKNLAIVNNHGLTHHELYPRWNGMLQRCENKKQSSYRNYGGRGIKVCAEWHDVKNFIEWAYSNGYEKELSIDRIDANGNYEPSNCRWVTMKEQSFNKTNSVKVTFNRETKCIMEWAEELKIPRSNVSRYHKKGIDYDKLIEKYYKKIPR